MMFKIFFTSILLFIISCQPSSKQEPAAQSKLTTKDSLKITQEVLGVVNDYTQAHNNMDAAKAADYFVNSPEFVCVENAELDPSWDALAKMIKNWYSNAASAKFGWENEKVLVLSKNSAAMTGKFNFEATLKNKKKYASTGHATIVFVKQNDQWKFYHYHESYKAVNK